MIVADATASEILAWGVLGMGLSLVMRPAPEWSTALAGFGLLAAIAAGSLLLAHFGIAALGLLAVFGFLCESVFTILHALRLQVGRTGGVALTASGVAAAVIGLALLWNWPEIAGSGLELILCLNFLILAAALSVVGISTWRDAA